MLCEAIDRVMLLRFTNNPKRKKMLFFMLSMN